MREYILVHDDVFRQATPLRVVKDSTKLKNRFSKASSFAKFIKPVFEFAFFKNSAETGFSRFFFEYIMGTHSGQKI